MCSADIILPYFPYLTSRQIEQFSTLGLLYREWNQRINVVSRKDIDALYEHHVLHSLAIAKVISFAPSAKILDIGTGGGFPGIPLAIFFPEAQFHLIDAIAKKLKVVDAIAGSLQLTNVTSQHIRAEQLRGQYDFIVSRAVTTFHSFLPWIQGKILSRRLHKVSNGAFFLKGGDIDNELGAYHEKATVFSISDFFPDPFFEGKKVIYLPVK